MRQPKVIDVLNKMDDRLDKIDVTLARQEVHLAEHIRRTELLEKQINPIQTHVTRMDGAMKLVGLISVLVSIAFAVIKIFQAL